jgi:N-methylhydantoinase A
MRHDYVTALGGITTQDVNVAELEAGFLRMEAEGAAELETQDFDADHIRLTRFADLKVVGQTYELSLPINGTFDAGGLARLIDAFGDLYRERYAFFFEGEPIELVNLRVSALGLNEPLVLPAGEASGVDPTGVRKGTRPVYFEHTGFVDTAIFERDRLGAGMVVTGPAVIEEQTSSTVIPPGIKADVAADFGLIVRLKD